MWGILNWVRTLFGHPPPGTPVFVDVYASGRPGNVSFSHKWRFRGGLKKSGKIDVPAKRKGQDGTPIHFSLENDTSPSVDLRFVADDNAIWVDRTTCPRDKAAKDPEITKIRPSGTKLTVLDLNEDE